MIRWKECRGHAEVFIVLVLALAASGGSLQRASILVDVQTAEPGDVQTLAEMGLDVWEVREGAIVALVTPEELAEMARRGLATEVVEPNVYEFLDSPHTREITLAADPNEPEGRYHSYEEIVQGLYELLPSGVAHVESIGSTIEGRDIVAIKISDHPEIDEDDEPELLFVGCHHAREWIAAEVPFFLARHLAGNYEADEKVARWVNACEIWIVPVVNPDGLEYSRTADRLWRKNRRDNGDGTFGVDLSRNYGRFWGLEGSVPDTSSPNYRGTQPFSEPEAQAIRNLVLRSEFRTFVTYHSYAQLVVYPWGYTTLESPDDCLLSGMAQNVAGLLGAVNGREYVPRQLGLWYLVSGDEIDWTYGQCGITSLSIELPPATSEQGGFLLPADQIVPTCQENLPAAFYLIAWSLGYGTVENVTTGRQFDHIQSAICDANDGDEIVVHEGVYPEHIDFRGKSLILRSVDPNDPNVVAATVIAGHRPAPLATFSSGEDETSVLSGLTLTGGTAGVYCEAASPTIIRCTIGGAGPVAVEIWYGYEPCRPPVIDCNMLGTTEQHDPKIAHWKLDEPEGTTARDSAGTHDALLLGDPLWRPNDGRIDGALELDGIDDGAEADFVLNPEKTPFSVFAWVRGGAPGQVILSQSLGDNWLTADRFWGHLTTEIQTRHTAFGFSSEAPITDGDWHHVGLVWDDEGTRSLYVDGLETARETGVYPWASWYTDGGVRIGAPRQPFSPNFFAGWIDDVRIYNRAVTP
ncbi:MAG: hypothetical protein JW741_16405 [Sedimentisphaerales bacterium]|nr:hypothetical protein [Sedimentisphaerales bacterium]